MNQPQGCFFGDSPHYLKVATSLDQSPYATCVLSIPSDTKEMCTPMLCEILAQKKKTASWDPTHAVLGLHGFDQPIFHQRRRITELLHDCSAKKISIQLEKIQNQAGFRRMCFFRKLGFKIGMFKISRVKILWA